jgi:N-glycosylase/DNA lyase
MPLLLRLTQGKCPKTIRRQLVNDIPGLGPKQASMFLRNIGRTFELAILDTHVLSFMEMQKLIPRGKLGVATMRAYERIEECMIKYAKRLGYAPGYLDFAIWATMKAARELQR